jgi:hypothetical protein
MLEGDVNTSLRCEMALHQFGRLPTEVVSARSPDVLVLTPSPIYLLAPASAICDRLCATIPQPTHRPIPRSPW